MGTKSAALLLVLAASLAHHDASAQPPEEKPGEPGEAKAPEPTKPAEPAPAEKVEGAQAEAKGEGATADTDLETPPQPSIDSDDERPVPDYDGRGDDPITAGDVFIWIPRGIFFPLYVLAEYGIRWPVGKLVTLIEEEDIPKKLVDFFTFGPEGKTGLVPSFLIDFGFRPSIGLYLFSDDTLWPGSAIRAHGAFGGIDWYRATLALRHRIADETVDTHAKFVQAKFAFNHRPDWYFYGIGPDTTDDTETRYTAQTIDGFVVYDGGFWRSSHIRAEVGVSDVRFKNIACCDELTLLDGVAQGFFPKPAHFDDGYLIAHGGVVANVDTRERRNAYEGDASDHVSPPATGIKVGARGRFAGGLRDSDIEVNGVVSSERPLFVSYGGTLGGFVDIYNQRSVGLELTADFIDPVGDSTEVPFFELISLGGSRPLRGFLNRRLLGRSSATAQLEYRWPIWTFLDGTVHYGVGNVFSEHLEDFDLEKLRQSVGIGFRGVGSHDHAFEILLAFGFQTFEQLDGEDDLDTVRFVFGSTEGF